MPFSRGATNIRWISFGHATSRGAMALPVSVWILAAILVAVPSVSYARDSSIATFDQSYRSYCSLLKNKQASRDEWLHVIAALIASAHPKSRESRRTGLLYAGRAYIELFQRSGRHEDLDRAIRLLDKFKAVTRDDTEWITGLKELKRAYTLRRRRPINRSGAMRRSRTAKRISSFSRVSAAKRVFAPASLTAFPPTPPEHAARPGPPAGPGHKPAAIQGNPFYSEHNLQVAKLSPPRLHAALQPSTGIVDDTVRPEVCIKPEPPPQRPNLSPNRQEPQTARRFVVAVDPGHGGKDPGAVSLDGKLKEKDVTLALAKRIKARLEANGKATGITVFLTRSDDSFLSVSERTARANAANADLFISIHCNAYSDSSASGVETYYLSKAKSRRAMMVAARENAIPLSRMTDLEATLLDLVITSKKNESEKLAETVHRSLIGTIHLSRPRMNRGVRQAPFYVLLGVTVPAVLVECAYMSNSRESARLADPHYLDLIAKGISRGAEAYVKGLREVCRREPRQNKRF